MARLILQGDVAEVELTIDDEDGQIIATCVQHPGRWQTGGCGWTERYDGMDDATEYAAYHADTGRQS
jgi:hypothetical protein